LLIKMQTHCEIQNAKRFATPSVMSPKFLVVILDFRRHLELYKKNTLPL
jgi:hypothetical protein